jgi:hypothetical protein
VETIIEGHHQRQEVAKEKAVKRLSHSSIVAESVSPAGHRLLLAASFRLFLRRLQHGFPVTRTELVYLLPYADDADHDAGVAA